MIRSLDSNLFSSLEFKKEELGLKPNKRLVEEVPFLKNNNRLKEMYQAHGGEKTKEEK